MRWFESNSGRYLTVQKTGLFSFYYLPGVILLSLYWVTGASAKQPILSEQILQQAMNPDSIQKILYEDVRGTGEKDAVVFYSNSEKCGVAIFGQKSELLWKQEEDCWGGSGDIVYLDNKTGNKNLSYPFIQLTASHNASIGSTLYLFQWDGKKFNQAFVNYDDNERAIIRMPDGHLVMKIAYRGRELAYLYDDEDGKVVECSVKYPAFYQTYIDKAYQSLHAMESTDDSDTPRDVLELNPGNLNSNYLRAFIYAGKYEEGLRFCEKFRSLLNQRDAEELDKVVAGYKKYYASLTVTAPSFKQTVPTVTKTPSTKNQTYKYNRPNLLHINLKLHQQFMEIYEALKAGKITAEQSETLRANLKKIDQQKKELYKNEKKDDLKKDSESQLDQSLNENEKSLIAAGVM
jgi:hypothetical protein